MSTAIPTITTSRLILRPLDLTDVDAVQALFPRWEIVRFLATHVPWPYPTDGALTFIRDVVLPAMRQGTEWHWSIRPKPTPEQLIGVISLRDKPDDNRGFWLDSNWHGQGLMTEASGRSPTTGLKFLLGPFFAYRRRSRTSHPAASPSVAACA
jgi:[ribosomal protein S5]-alanine N-acetyltransferase